MSNRLVTFASLNEVALLKRALHARGFFVDMQRTPTCLAKKGCGFALLTNAETQAAIAEECAKMKITSAGVFEEDGEGGWRDLTPAQDGL